MSESCLFPANLMNNKDEQDIQDQVQLLCWNAPGSLERRGDKKHC